MANAVIVVDMLRGFLEAGYPLYCGDRARDIIPRIQALLQRSKQMQNPNVPMPGIQGIGQGQMFNPAGGGQPPIMTDPMGQTRETVQGREGR